MAINKAFVVKNGLEVNTNLILANADTKRVGIGSTIPAYTLDVRGGIAATNTYTSGISTVINELRVGTGGTVFSVIAGPVGSGQSVGVGSASPAYLLDVRSPVSTGQTALYVYGDARITGDLVVDDLVFDDATVQDLRVQETLFVGADGGAGIATIKQLNVSGLTTTNQLIAYGISTFRANAQFIDNTSLYFGDGADLNIYHDGSNSYIQEQGAGNLYVQSNGGSINIRTNSTENAFVANQDGSVELYFDNAKKFETLSIGATVTGTLFTNQLSSSGVATANAYYVGGTQVISSSRQLQNIASLDATTTATIEAAIANGPNTFTDITVSGVSTFVGLATFNSGLQVVSGVTTLGTVRVSSGIITATSGIVTYYGDGSYLTGNARNLTATIGVGTTGGVVGYGVSFIQFAGPGVSTVYYNGNTGIATVTITGGGSGSASIGIGTTPGEAFTGIVTAGNLWYNSNLGRMFIYYQDVDSAQWVDASPSNVGVITSLTNVSFAPGSASSPSMYVLGDPQTGFFSPGAGQFTVVSTGSSVLNINPSGIRITGVATASSFVGNLTGTATYATSAGIATYATSAGIATYATTSGVSTSVIGGISSVTQLNVSGVSTVGFITATNSYTSGISSVGTAITMYGSTGVVSATKYYGDGSSLLGISTSRIINGTSNITVENGSTISATVSGQNIFNVTGAGVSMVAGERFDVSSYSENVQFLGSVSGTTNLGIGTYSVFVADISGTTSVTFQYQSGALFNGRLFSGTLILRFSGTGTRNVSLTPLNPKYVGGSGPTYSTTAVTDIISFFTADNGATTYITVVGQGFA